MASTICTVYEEHCNAILALAVCWNNKASSKNIFIYNA